MWSKLYCKGNPKEKSCLFQRTSAPDSPIGETTDVSNLWLSWRNVQELHLAKQFLTEALFNIISQLWEEKPQFPVKEGLSLPYWSICFLSISNFAPHFLGKSPSHYVNWWKMQTMPKFYCLSTLCSLKKWMPYDEYLKSKSKLKVYTYFWDTLYTVKKLNCGASGPGPLVIS